MARWVIGCVLVFAIVALVASWLQDSGAPARGRSTEEEAVTIDRLPRPAGSPPEAPDANPAQVDQLCTVRVVDAVSQVPIAGARITGSRWEDGPPICEATSDECGEAKIAPFWGSLRVRAKSYVTARRSVRAHEAGITVALRGGTPVEGSVVWKGTARGVEGATVTATDAESADELDAVTTDATGRFVIAGVSAGRPFVLEARRAGLAPVGRMVFPTGREIRIELGGGGLLTGRVLGPDGVPSAGAEVTVRPLGGCEQLLTGDGETFNTGYVAGAVTDEAGQFRLKGLRVPAAYEVTARDVEGAEATATPAAFARAGDRVHRELRLERRTTVVIEVSSPDSEPSPSPSISLWRDGKVVGTQGHVYTHVLEEGGDYEVLVVASNWPPTRVPVHVREGRRNLVRVPLSRDLQVGLSGRVVASNSRPVRGIRVWFGAEGTERSTRTGPDGRFHLYDLPSAPGRLVVLDQRGIRAGWSRDGVRAGDGPFEVEMSALARFVGRLEPVPYRVLLHRRYRHHIWKKEYEISVGPLAFDPTGRFEIPWSPERGIRLVFEPTRGAAVVLDEPPLKLGEVRDLGIVRFGPGHDAVGVVLDGEGNPVVGARVLVEIEDVFRDRVVFTDPDGRFRFDGLPHMPLSIEVSAGGFLPHLQAFAAGRELGLPVIRLAAAGVLAGRLKRSGVALPAAEIEILPIADGEEAWATTDSVGRFRAELPPGRYRIVHGEDRGPEVEVRAKQTTTVEFVVE